MRVIHGIPQRAEGGDYDVMDVKVVKRGNSLALLIPSSAGFKRGEAFLLISDEKV